MEFETTVLGEQYRISFLNQQSFLVSGPQSEYILYKKSKNWYCADEIREGLLEELAMVLDERLQYAH